MRINLGPRFLVKSHDGGKDSGVTGYWLIEWKRGFSIVLLRFSKGSREAYHSHGYRQGIMVLVDSRALDRHLA